MNVEVEETQDFTIVYSTYALPVVTSTRPQTLYVASIRIVPDMAPGNRFRAVSLDLENPGFFTIKVSPLLEKWGGFVCINLSHGIYVPAYTLDRYNIIRIIGSSKLLAHQGEIGQICLPPWMSKQFVDAYMSQSIPQRAPHVLFLEAYGLTVSIPKFFIVDIPPFKLNGEEKSATALMTTTAGYNNISSTSTNSRAFTLFVQYDTFSNKPCPCGFGRYTLSLGYLVLLLPVPILASLSQRIVDVQFIVPTTDQTSATQILGRMRDMLMRGELLVEDRYTLPPPFCGRRFREEVKGLREVMMNPYKLMTLEAILSGNVALHELRPEYEDEEVVDQKTAKYLTVEGLDALVKSIGLPEAAAMAFFIWKYRNIPKFVDIPVV